jgi:hypothetical protein
MSNNFATSKNWNFFVFDSVDEMQAVLGGSGSMREFVSLMNSPFKYKDLVDETLEEIKNLQRNIDLGGALNKARLKITDNPSGVFDFGLASLGLIRVVEFYSENLSKAHPGAYISENLLPGVVPNELVDQEDGKFYTTYKGKPYQCQKRQKGTTFILTTNPRLKLVDVGGLMVPENYQSKEALKDLKFSSTNKKSYIEFDRKGGTVPYLDFVIPLQLLPGIAGDPLASLTAQLPIILLSNFLNQAGVQTRIYAARAVMTNASGAKPWGAWSNDFTPRNRKFSNGTSSIGFGDMEPSAYCTAEPSGNRIVALKLKDRTDTRIPIEKLGNFFSEAYDTFNSATYRGLIDKGANNIGQRLVGEYGVTYAYPSQSAWQGTFFERWLKWVSREKLFGEGYLQNGWYMSPKLGANPAPYGRTLVTSMFPSQGYDLRSNIKSGELMNVSNPFGFHFYLYLDFAELSLGTDLNIVANRIYKRWKKNNFPDQQIINYVTFLAKTVLYYKGINPLQQFQLEFGRLPNEQIMQSVPFSADQTKIYDKKNSELVSAIVELIRKLK